MVKCLVVHFMEKIGIRLLKYTKIVSIAMFVVYGGDTIRFVENLFNLPFKDAMQKINIDFNMGLDSNYVDYERLRKLKNIQNEKKKQKEKLLKKYSEQCRLKHYYEKIINEFKSKINIKNWERIVSIISYFETKVSRIDENLNYIDNILSSRN